MYAMTYLAQKDEISRIRDPEIRTYVRNEFGGVKPEWLRASGPAVPDEALRLVPKLRRKIARRFRVPRGQRTPSEPAAAPSDEACPAV